MINIIAEIGWNHMGNMDLAEKMIKAAKASGATHAKFQNWKESKLKKGPWDHDGRRDIYKKAELNHETTKKIYKICQNNNISFLTSIFDTSEADFISSIDNRIIKIPSPEMRNIELLEACSKLFNCILLSTGASSLDEVKNSIKIIKLKNTNCKIILLHCVSIYPCDDQYVRLNRISKLKEINKSIGISDHTTDSLSSIFSIPFGIEVIEKHFTIDNNLPGRDNKFALLPDEFIKISIATNRFYKMYDEKDNGNNFLEQEKEVREFYSGRWSGN
jgi:sialic acid synthase SpsE